MIYCIHCCKLSGPSEVETEGYEMLAYLALYNLPDTSVSDKAVYRQKATALQESLLSMRKDDGFFASTQVNYTKLNTQSKL